MPEPSKKTLRSVQQAPTERQLPIGRPMPLNTDVAFGQVPERVVTAEATPAGGGGAAFVFPGTGVPGPEMGFQADPIGLSHLESYVSPGTVTPEGEYQPPPELQAFMDDPNLAQVNADLARIQSQDPELLPADELTEYRAAEKRIEDYAYGAPDKPTTLKPTPTLADVERFETEFINKAFGGVDPRTRNIYEEVSAIGPETYRSTFEQMYPDAMMLYDDLDAKTKSDFDKSVRAQEFKRIQEQIQLQVEAFNRTMDQARTEAAQTAKAEETRKKAIARMKASSMKTREQAQERAVELSGKLNDATAELQAKLDAGDPEAIATHRQYIQQLTIALKDATRKATETEVAGAPKRTGEEGGKLKPSTTAMARKYLAEADGDPVVARQRMIAEGFDPQNYTEEGETPAAPAAAATRKKTKRPAETGNELFSTAAGA